MHNTDSELEYKPVPAWDAGVPPPAAGRPGRVTVQAKFSTSNDSDMITVACGTPLRVVTKKPRRRRRLARRQNLNFHVQAWVFAAGILKSLAASSGNRDWARIAVTVGESGVRAAGKMTDQPACTFLIWTTRLQGMVVRGWSFHFCSPRQKLNPLAVNLPESWYDYKFKCLNNLASINYAC